MSEYRIHDSGIQALRRRLIGMMVVYGVIIVAVVIIVNLASNAMQGGAVVVALIVAVVIAATLGFMTWRTLGAQTTRWRSIRFRIDHEWIEREDPPAAPVRIERSAIGSIQETGAGILVKTVGDRREISVPKLIGAQEYGEVRDRLSACASGSPAEFISHFARSSCAWTRPRPPSTAARRACRWPRRPARSVSGTGT